MESSVAPKRAKDAATIAEAFRITAREHTGQIGDPLARRVRRR